MNSPQHNEVYEINAFYAEIFSFFISHGHLLPFPMKAVNDDNDNSFRNQWAFAILETEDFKYNFNNFYVAKTMMCILLKFVQLMLNK